MQKYMILYCIFLQSLHACLCYYVSFGHMESTFSYHYTLCVLSVDSVSTETVNNLFLYGERL